jgi:hypothetical protein
MTVPFDGTITRWELTGDTIGDVVVDIRNTGYAGFPGSALDSICAIDKPEITGDSKNFAIEATALVGWTKVVSAGDRLLWNFDNLNTFKVLTLSVFIDPT